MKQILCGEIAVLFILLIAPPVMAQDPIDAVIGSGGMIRFRSAESSAPGTSNILRSDLAIENYRIFVDLDGDGVEEEVDKLTYEVEADEGGSRKVRIFRRDGHLEFKIGRRRVGETIRDLCTPGRDCTGVGIPFEFFGRLTESLKVFRDKKWHLVQGVTLRVDIPKPTTIRHR